MAFSVTGITTVSDVQDGVIIQPIYSEVAMPTMASQLSLSPSTTDIMGVVTERGFVIFYETETPFANDAALTDAFAQMQLFSQYVGDDGTPGDNGQSTRIDYAYAVLEDGTGFSTTAVDLPFRGTHSPVWTTGDTPPTQSTTPSDYTFAQFVGNAWLSGTGAPAAALGYPGDWYVNLDTEQTFQKTSTTVWSAQNILAGDRINTVYIESADTPATPADSFSSVPSGWLDNPPANPTLPVWASLGNQDGGQGAFVFDDPSRLTGDAGTTGRSARVDFAYATGISGIPEIQRLPYTGTRSNVVTPSIINNETLTIGLPSDYSAGVDGSVSVTNGPNVTGTYHIGARADGVAGGTVVGSTPDGTHAGTIEVLIDGFAFDATGTSTINGFSSVQDADMSDLATAAGWNGTDPIIMTVPTGTWLWASSTSVPGLNIPNNVPARSIVINNGNITGYGGSANNNGGPAITNNATDVFVTNAAGAFIAGGGGGGSSSGGAGGGGAGQSPIGQASSNGSTTGTICGGAINRTNGSSSGCCCSGTILAGSGAPQGGGGVDSATSFISCGCSSCGTFYGCPTCCGGVNLSGSVANSAAAGGSVLDPSSNADGPSGHGGGGWGNAGESGGGNGGAAIGGPIGVILSNSGTIYGTTAIGTSLMTAAGNRISISSYGTNYQLATATLNSGVTSTTALNTIVVPNGTTWSFTTSALSPDSFTFDPDVANTVYGSGVILGTTSLTGNLAQSSPTDTTPVDTALNEIATAIAGLDSGITWDSAITTVSGERRITIDLGTLENIEASFTLNTNSGRNGTVTMIIVNGSDIAQVGAHSTYSLVDPGGNSVVSFTSSVLTSSDSDLDFVIDSFINAINDNTPEMPLDFVAEDDRPNTEIDLTALQSGVLSGLFVATVSAEGITGADQGNITVGPGSVVITGTASTITDTQFGSGLVTDGNHLQPIATVTPIPNNLVAERSINWLETEPAVSQSAADYAFRELLSARSPGIWPISVTTLPGNSIAVEAEFLMATLTPAESVEGDTAIFYTGSLASPTTVGRWTKIGETVWAVSGIL